MMTAFWQWWPARCRTRHSSFSSWLCLRITWKTEGPSQTTPMVSTSRDGEDPKSGSSLPSASPCGDLGGGAGGGQSCGGSHGHIHPHGLWGARAGGGMCPAQGLQARTCCSAGAGGGKPRGVSPGAAAALASSLPATDRASTPAHCGHRRRGTSLSPGRGGDRRVTSGRTPGGRNESRGTGTHPLGDGAAPGALPLLPCVDDLLDADGLAFLTIPAGGQASALLAPHYAHESPRLTSWAPHKPPLASWDPTHPPWNPHEPPPTLRSPHSPSQDATRLHRTPQDPTRPFEPRLILTGLHLPSWDPIHLHRTPLAFTRPQGGPPPTLTSPRSPSQDPTHPCGPHLPSRTPRRTPFALTGSPRPHGIPHRPPTCPHRTPHKPQFSLVGSHLLSRDPTHPYRPPLTLIGPYSPSRNPTCPHGTLLALMGPH